jgi:hypothetical protein
MVAATSSRTKKELFEKRFGIEERELHCFLSLERFPVGLVLALLGLG